jgi:hypothetical protein
MDGALPANFLNAFSIDRGNAKSLKSASAALPAARRAQ